MRKLVLSILSSLLVVGCNSVESDVVDTDGLFADFSVVATGNGRSEVSATLRVGGPTSSTFLALQGGDELIAYLTVAGGTTEVSQGMDERHLGGATWYETEFTTQQEGDVFRIEFDRALTGKLSALSSSVTMPKPFLLSTDPAGTSFSRSDSTPYYVLWDPFDFAVGDQLTYEITGSCIQKSVGGIDWSTYDSLQLSDGFLLPAAGHESESCDIRVKLALSRNGDVDPAFEDGVFVARQERELTLHVSP